MTLNELFLLSIKKNQNQQQQNPPSFLVQFLVICFYQKPKGRTQQTFYICKYCYVNKSNNLCVMCLSRIYHIDLKIGTFFAQ